MPASPYRIALASRGAGAFAYTYLGPAGLPAGQLVAVRFRQRLEIGVVVSDDHAPPASLQFETLLPLHCRVHDLGALLLELCEAAAASAHEILPRLGLRSGAVASWLSLELSGALSLSGAAGRAVIGCAGKLNRKALQALARPAAWEALLGAAAVEEARLRLEPPGCDTSGRGLASWGLAYEVDAMQASELGLLPRTDNCWSGGYLAGLAHPPRLAALRRSKQARQSEIPKVDGGLRWDSLGWPDDWDISRRWPQVGQLALRRTQSTLPRLRSASGLLAELAASLERGQRILLLAPQSWLLDSLWPQLAGLAPWLLRYRADLSGAALSHLLKLAAAGPCVIAATESGWRLPVYARFDRIVLLDPSHPQWQPEAAPWLDPRPALLLAAARRGSAVDLAELGLSAIDGKLAHDLSIMEPYSEPTGATPPDPTQDSNPLPLKLRQAGQRRLVFFNRLGSSRAISCVECLSLVRCPQCASNSLRYSAASKQFSCPSCGLSERELRCPRCGLATLAARLPGLEALRVRSADVIVGGQQPASAGPESGVVLGTLQLLEPAAGYWPEQIVCVDPEERDLLGSDWRSILDMAARLAALYANPELREVVLVSSRLAERLASPLSPSAAAKACAQEAALLRLAGLPPFGPLYHLRTLAAARAALETSRDLLGTSLKAQPGTSLLRLGKAFQRQGRWELHGLLLNAALPWPELQELRWQVHTLGATLGIRAQRGPWI